MRRFVEDARVRFALLLHPSGQVLGQHGFTRPVDVMSACALASAIHASAAELGLQVDGRPFTQLLHAGQDRRLFLAEARTQGGALIFLTVFGGESSAGLVQLYFRELASALADAAPPPDRRRALLAQEFEQDLERSLAALFTAASSDPDAAGTRRTPV
jgi:hypothetical protein